MSEFLAETHNLSIDQGDDETLAITRQDADGNAIDISGYTYWLTVKADINDSDADAEVQKQVTTHVDAANGRTDITLTASDTEPLAGNYHYDIQEKTNAGNINTLMHGTLTVREDVTEAT